MDALRSQAIIKIPCGIFQASGDFLCYAFRVGGCVWISILSIRTSVRCETCRDELLIALPVMEVIGLLVAPVKFKI
ncbi:hypothetical protein LU631_19290 [Erwinia tracheiphila]|uniref:Uncharacterized protein n=1 Tax=Erwinia tracheiphila TaxID=65700 RepID=A0A0M2K7B6_9GAMM|nr:hypothetical protein [Erwinia tracheiphila]AXF76604.1 hypothetical protein AV903_12060 [Erwinia tracheiphila]EOS96133.1 hypothetical protein ETR_04479 [Erwinia tracheiphila PSU-1]KKF35285.1 hypothetical protein SY86_07380 [Erwinia tracheiphila]UIA84724.1 hypothetical protein LU604_07245 [Erwinia tracheiphila]UIA86948.1 hypothetical protein LU631_19290 [Erwinia tracheiphila]